VGRGDDPARHAIEQQGMGGENEHEQRREYPAAQAVAGTWRRGRFSFSGSGSIAT